MYVCAEVRQRLAYGLPRDLATRGLGPDAEAEAGSLGVTECVGGVVQLPRQLGRLR